jgi:hypothetical protein
MLNLFLDSGLNLTRQKDDATGYLSGADFVWFHIGFEESNVICD